MYCFLYPEEYSQEIEVENIGDDDEDLESVDRQENDNYKVAYGWYRRRHMVTRRQRRRHVYSLFTDVGDDNQVPDIKSVAEQENVGQRGR